MNDNFLERRLGMKIVLCEDEDKYAEQLIGYINEWAEDKNISAEIFKYTTAEEFLYEWDDGEDYDLLFLDIKMGSMTGMELAKIIRRTNRDIPIIFVTNMREYAVEGYSVAATHFLVKPVKKDDCFACLDKIYRDYNTVKKHFVFKDIDRTVKILHRDIIYIEMFSHEATLITTNGDYTLRKKTKDLLEAIDDDLFVLCHRSLHFKMQGLREFTATLRKTI
jgi:DNA-binding LytR/AlgR family response regulator